jgi:hypothetical protein
VPLSKYYVTKYRGTATPGTQVPSNGYQSMANATLKIV